MNDTIHDCIYSIFGDTPSDALIEKVLEIMPRSIFIIGDEWGPNDTVFRDDLYIWIQENRELIASYWTI